MEDIKDAIKGNHILVEYEDKEGNNRKVAFNGKWLFEDEREDTDNRLAGTLYSVALTEKQQLFVMWSKDDVSEYEVYLSFDDMVNDDALPPGLTSFVAEKIGENYIEYLDI